MGLPFPSFSQIGLWRLFSANFSPVCHSEPLGKQEVTLRVSECLEREGCLLKGLCLPGWSSGRPCQDGSSLSLALSLLLPPETAFCPLKLPRWDSKDSGSGETLELPFRMHA